MELEVKALLDMKVLHIAIIVKRVNFDTEKASKSTGVEFKIQKQMDVYKRNVFK